MGRSLLAFNTLMNQDTKNQLPYRSFPLIKFKEPYIKAFQIRKNCLINFF